MNRTKTTLLLIVFAAIGIAWWQGRELSQLKQREAGLKRIFDESKHQHSTPNPAPDRRNAEPALDAKGFVGMLSGWLEKGVPPTRDEREFLRKQIEAASGRDLKQWALALRESGLPEEMKNDFLAAIAPRIAETDPKLAAELVLTGEDGNPFRSVLRTWLATDALAASAWLQTVDPPVFRRPQDFDYPAFSMAAKIAGDPASTALLLDLNGKQARRTLEELSSFQAPGDFAKVLRQLSGSSRIPENERLHIIGAVLASHRNPAAARQILLDAALPSDQFVRVALTLIQSLDPAGKSAGIAWVKSLPDPAQRDDLLRMLETQSSLLR
jgi:hypothetical protein